MTIEMSPLTAKKIVQRLAGTTPRTAYTRGRPVLYKGMVLTICKASKAGGWFVLDDEDASAIHHAPTALAALKGFALLYGG